MVAENSQYWPEVVRAKELIDQGIIMEECAARMRELKERREKIRRKIEGFTF